MAGTALSTFILCVFLSFQGSFQIQDCGYFEEGKFQVMSCSLKLRTEQAFTGFGPRLTINGTLEETGYCNSSGVCSVTDPTRYDVKYQVNNDTGRVSKVVAVFVGSVDRSITKLQCYINGQPMLTTVCLIKVYVKASELECAGPEFVDGNTIAVYNCTSERVYPGGRCIYKSEDGSNTTANRQFLKVVTTEHDSAHFPGDKEITCQLRVDLSGIPEDVYSFLMGIIPDLPGLSLDAATLSTMPSLPLVAVALYRPSDNNPMLDYPLASEELRVNIYVTGNPPPNHFSLRVRHDETSIPYSLGSQDYSVTHSASPNDVKTEITLIVTGGLDPGKMSYFFFEADNGVVGSSVFQYNFSVKRVNAQEKKDDIPIVAGSVVGGVVIVIVVAVVIIVKIKHRCQPQQTRAGQGFDPFSSTDNYIYPIDDINDELSKEKATDPQNSPTYEASVAYIHSSALNDYDLPEDFTENE